MIKGRPACVRTADNYSSSSLSTALASKQSPFRSQRPGGHCSLYFLASPFPAKPASLSFGGRTFWGRQLNSAQSAHFLLACSHTEYSVWVPDCFNARAKMNSALRKFSGPMALRIYGAQRRPICDGAPEGKKNAIIPRPA